MPLHYYFILIKCKQRTEHILRLSERYFIIALLCISSFLLVKPLLASEESNSGVSFIQWQQEFKLLALKSGVQEEIFNQAFAQLKLNQNVLKLDRSQPEFSWSIWKYIDNATTKGRIKKAKAILKKHHNLFTEVSKEYHVPAEIIVAIWGMESDFGGNYGNMNVIESLATLAYAGKRKQFAQKELLIALQILQKEKIDPNEMIGSWAGAMGHPQFMPSSFQKYAVDFNFDRKRDLWNSLDDAFASIANYMQSSGWRKNQTWGVEVILPDDFDWQRQAKFNPRNERLMVSEWRLWGIRPVLDNSFQNEDQLAELFLPAGHRGPAFLIFDNFKVIKKYNLSLSYSLAVGLLATAIKNNNSGGDDLLVGKWPRNDKPLSRSDKMQLQIFLNQQGFEAGKVDGKVGSKTRRAIRAWQLKNALAADGYVSLQLFEKIQKGACE